MKRIVLLLGLSLHLHVLGAAEPESEIVIVGGGIIGALEAYYAHDDAISKGKRVSVTIYDKGPSFEENAYSANCAFKIFALNTPM